MNSIMQDNEEDDIFLTCDYILDSQIW